MNRSSIEKRVQIVGALVEGNSLRATVRMTGAAMNTILKLLADVGESCEQYQDSTLRHLSCKRIQCDEIWQFCYAKNKNVPADKKGQFGYGDVWTWVALHADTKLVPCYAIGDRSAGTAYAFMRDLASRRAPCEWRFPCSASRRARLSECSAGYLMTCQVCVERIEHFVCIHTSHAEHPTDRRYLNLGLVASV